jgi:hypothetical protein
MPQRGGYAPLAHNDDGDAPAAYVSSSVAAAGPSALVREGSLTHRRSADTAAGGGGGDAGWLPPTQQALQQQQQLLHAQQQRGAAGASGGGRHHRRCRSMGAAAHYASALALAPAAPAAAPWLVGHDGGDDLASPG